MAKLARLDRRYWPRGEIGHWCPGCKAGHKIPVDAPNSSGHVWRWNGDSVRPTFDPSINYKVNTPDMGKDYQPDVASTVCHYFIRDGQIQYLADCTHALAGQTVPLPDLPAYCYQTSERIG